MNKSHLSRALALAGLVTLTACASGHYREQPPT